MSIEERQNNLGKRLQSLAQQMKRFADDEWWRRNTWLTGRDLDKVDRNLTSAEHFAKELEDALNQLRK